MEDNKNKIKLIKSVKSFNLLQIHKQIDKIDDNFFKNISMNIDNKLCPLCNKILDLKSNTIKYFAYDNNICKICYISITKN